MITKLQDFKLLKENYKDELKLISLIKAYLLEAHDYDTWEEFIDSQEMGDCQGIVADIIDEYSDLANTFGHKLVKCFGHIKIDEPVWVESMNDYNDLFTHHWVKFNDNILDFSKGTLKDYIEWNSLYTVGDGMDDDKYEEL